MHNKVIYIYYICTYPISLISQGHQGDHEIHGPSLQSRTGPLEPRELESGSRQRYPKAEVQTKVTKVNIGK